MHRRTILLTGLAAVVSRISKGAESKGWDAATTVLEEAVSAGTVQAASLHLSRAGERQSRSFGLAKGEGAPFLLGSITKPICVAACMTLFDEGEFHLEDRLEKFFPEFRGTGREQITIRHLLTHVSGLPDQLPENNELRGRHASLAEFVSHSLRLSPAFPPGTKYEYSSMGILLACAVAEKIAGTGIIPLVTERVLKKLKMTQSALGLGSFRREEVIACQTERAAPESGAGDPASRDWDWNSSYWRSLGAPWGGMHASAPDVASFLDEFLEARGVILKPETERMMVRNHNGPAITARGIGFNVGLTAGGSGAKGCSDRTFGHTGSTGTLAWADPATKTICVILTSLPARAIQPHPRDLAATAISA